MSFELIPSQVTYDEKTELYTTYLLYKDTEKELYIQTDLTNVTKDLEPVDFSISFLSADKWEPVNIIYNKELFEAIEIATMELVMDYQNDMKRRVVQ